MRLGGYVAVSKWMFRDTLLRYPWRSATGSALHFGGMSLQVAAVSVALLYARRLSSNEAFSFMGETILPQSSPALLIAVGLGSGLLLFGSSVMIWKAQHMILELRRQYYDDCVDRIFENIAERGAPEQLSDPKQQVRALFLLMRRDGLYCSRYFGALIGAIVPGLTAAAALATLIYTDPLLTAGFLLFLMAAGPFIYRGNRHSSGLSNQVDQRAPACAAELKGQLGEALEERRAEEQERPLSDAWMDAYMGRLGAAIHSDLIVNVVMSIAIASLVIGVGWHALSSNAGWGRIAVYLLALRYFLVHLKGFARCITTMNQFYAQAARYRDYVLNGRVPIEAGILDGDEDGSEDL